jgi:hypothetical protein
MLLYMYLNDCYSGMFSKIGHWTKLWCAENGWFCMMVVSHFLDVGEFLGQSEQILEEPDILTFKVQV